MNYHEHLTVFGHAQPSQKVTDLGSQDCWVLRWR